MRYVGRLLEDLGREVRQIASLDRRDIAPRLTLLLLVLYGSKFWDLHVPTVILAAFGMVLPRLSRSRWFWATLTAIIAIGTIPRVYVVDNHKVLMIWWCVALTLSTRSEAILGRNARLLIGLCFALATLWKAITPDFVDGSFMHHTLLCDGRFADMARLAAGVSPASLAENALRLERLYASEATSIRLLDSAACDAFAVGMTYWTILVEGLIGVCFLGAARWPLLARARNVVLPFFMIATYPVATVIGFGWLLAILGYAQCRKDEWRSRLLYLAVFVILQLYLVPWARVLDV